MRAGWLKPLFKINRNALFRHGREDPADSFSYG